MEELDTLTEAIKSKEPLIKGIKEEIAKIIVGQEEMVESLLIALLADGHVLLEGLPGLAKTLTVNTLAKVLHCDFRRIQFTPDLLPSDLIGTSIYNPKEGTFHVKQGPVFTNILLADEINRAPAKVQSALLEVMQEKQVTIGGESFKADFPYFVLATQNPIEQEGTYPLPEAQTDRFMLKVHVDYPNREEEKRILERIASSKKPEEPRALLSKEEIREVRGLVNSVHVDDKLIQYILDVVEATRHPEKFSLDLGKLILYGASPRASIALKQAAKAHAFLSGRAYVVPADIRRVVYEVLRHRIRRTYEAEAEGVSADRIIEQILQKLPAP